MLKVLRENIKYLSWILWVIIALFVLFVFVDFGAGVRQGGGQLAAAATVGGDVVTRVEFQRLYRGMENQYRQQLGAQYTPELAKRLRLPVAALDQLVTRKILLAEARRLGLQVSDQEVRDHILADPSFQDEKGRFVGDALYRRILAERALTSDGFEQQVREQAALEKVVDALRANLWVSDQEVEKSYRDQVERAKIRYLQLPGARFVQGQEIPPAEVAAYFTQHQEQYRLPEQREVAYLLVEAAKLLPQVKVDEGQMRSYYGAHQQDYAVPEQVRARQVLVQVSDSQSDEAARAKIAAAEKRIAGGEDFAKVAQEVSEDPASKNRGGELGFFGRNSNVPEFEEAAFSSPPGKLVGPIKSSIGYHLLEVEEKRAAGQRPFAEIQTEIGNRLMGEQLQTLADTRAKELAAKLAADKPASAEALEAYTKQDPTVSYALSGRFGQNEPVSGIGPSPAVGAAVFALEKGKLSAPIQVQRGWAIFYLKDVHPPHVPELAEVEPRVRLAMASERQEKAALERLAAAKREMAAGKSLDDIAKDLGVTLQETPEFGGQGTIPGLGYNPQLVQAAMALPQGAVGGPVGSGQGAVLFQVTERKAWDPQQFQGERAGTRSRLEQEKLGRVLAALIEQRRRELGVEYDRQLLESFGLTGEAAQPGQQS